jgi:hypothetical protein
MFRNSLLSSVIAVTSATLLFATSSPAWSASNQANTEALWRQNVDFRFPENGDRVDIALNPISVLLVKQSGGQGRGQGSGQGWRAIGISFGDIERPDENHEVVVFYPMVNQSGTKEYIAQPAFRAKPSDLGDPRRPIGQRGFDCGSVMSAGTNTTVEGGYSLCNSAFSKRDGLATGALLLMGGPLGVGSFKRFDREAMASALISANVLPLIIRVSAQRDQIGTISYDQSSPAGLMAQVQAGLKARIATAWTHDTSPASQAVLAGTQAKLADVSVWAQKHKATLRSNQNQLLSVSPVREGNVTPEFDAAMANAGTQAGQGGQNLVTQTLGSIGPDFGLCSALTPPPAIGELTTPAERRAITEALRLEDLRTITIATSTGDRFTWRLACTNTQDQAWRLRSEPVAYSGSGASLVKDWRAEDGTLGARMDKTELVLRNIGTSFVTIKGISLHLGSDVVTVTKGSDAILVIPPGGEVTLGGPETLGAIHAKLGIATTQLRNAPVGDQSFAPKVNAGFSILYDAGGPPKTLSRVGPVVVQLAASPPRP